MDLQQELVYTIRLIQGDRKGEVLKVRMSLEDSREYTVSEWLIDNEVFESMGYPTDYYDLLSVDIE